MPIYEYRCRKCNEVSEQLLKSSSDTPAACPKCGAGDLEKVLSAPGSVGGSRSDDICSRCEGDSSGCGLSGPCGRPPCRK